MAEKFQNKYRIESARAQWWDYGNNGSYFITICTRNREHFFGEISNDEMQLSQSGKIARKCYVEIQEQFPYVLLDEFVVMPNHVHGIIIIDKPITPNINNAAVVGTPLMASLQQPTDPINPVGGFAGTKNPMLNENLSRVLRWFKGRVSFECRKINPTFGWQSRFHDHIIRNEEEYHRIRKYIKTNPQNWKIDKLRN